MCFLTSFSPERTRQGTLRLCWGLFCGVLAIGLALPGTALPQDFSAETKLVGSDSAEGDWFGRRVAIDGETLVVGAPQNDPNGAVNAGAAYVFVRTGEGWEEQAKLVDADGETGDVFGSDVAISGDTIAVSSPGYDGVENNSGGAFIFVRDGASWSHQATLVGDDAWLNTAFAGPVSISGDTIVVGDPGDDNLGTQAGAVYVWVRNGTTWGPTPDGIKLQADDPSAYAGFGRAVSIDGDTLAVASNWFTYVFVESGGTWSPEDKFVGTDTVGTDNYGSSVSVSGNTLLVGAPQKPFDPLLGAGPGAAYVFVRNASTWTEEAILTGSLGENKDNFGRSVSLNGDLALLGAPMFNTGAREGKAYLFKRNGTDWTEEALVQPLESPSTYYELGRSVAIGSEAFVLGSHSLQVSPKTGAAYVFDLLPTEPLPLIEDLMVQVVDLQLPWRLERSLLVKLRRASRFLSDSRSRNDRRAPRVMERFIRVVERNRGGRISEEDADALVEAALEIIALLEDGP